MLLYLCIGASQSIGFNEHVWFCCNVLKKSSDADTHVLTSEKFERSKIREPLVKDSHKFIPNVGKAWMPDSCVLQQSIDRFENKQSPETR